jgi:molybdopterin-binding protein
LAVSAPAYKAGQVAELLGVSVDTVRRLGARGELETRRTAGGQHLYDGADLARHLREHAGDAESEIGAVQSARNRFAGIVTRVVKDKVMAQVEIHAGPHRIVSLISREAADELGLVPGVLAVAAVKSTNVMVERQS